VCRHIGHREIGVPEVEGNERSEGIETVHLSGASRIGKSEFSSKRGHRKSRNDTIGTVHLRGRVAEIGAIGERPDRRLFIG
jgi:hypothetical protein